MRRHEQNVNTLQKLLIKNRAKKPVRLLYRTKYNIILINLAQLTILSLHIESQFDLIENIYGVLQNVSRSNFNCAEKSTLDLYYKQVLRNRLLSASVSTQYEESGVLQSLTIVFTQGQSSLQNIVYVTWSRNIMNQQLLSTMVF